MRVFVALLLVAAVSAKAPLHKNSEPIPGQYIVKIKEGYGLDDAASRVRLSGGVVGNMYRRASYGFAAHLSEKVLDLVRNLDAVEYVEENGVYRIKGSTAQWNLDRIDQRDGGDGYYYPRGSGSGYSIWVVDTGVYAAHPDFNGRAQQTVNYAGGANADCNGHGTHTAGTAGSTTYGVANGAQIRGVKVLGCDGSGTTDAVVSGCEYVLNNGGNNAVALLPLGGGASTTLDNAVNNLVSNGIPTAVAAGSSDACATSPSRAPLATTASATGTNDCRLSSSGYGSCIDIFAPGQSVTSTWNDGGTATLTGSSMAAAHVAGGLAVFGQSEANMKSVATAGQLCNLNGSPDLLLYVGF